MGVPRRKLAVMVAVLLVLGVTLHPGAQEGVEAACGGWTRVISADVAKHLNELYGVAPVGTALWAVGSHRSPSGDSRTFTQRWNGKAWQIIPSPNPSKWDNNELHAVAGASSTDVWAVGGTSSYPLIEHWNGTEWSVVPDAASHDGATLFGVSVIAADDVWAVGYQNWRQEPLIEHWDGATWTEVPGPSPSSMRYGGDGELFAVTALATDDVWAAGILDLSPFYIHWDGTTWTRVAGPPSSHGGWIDGIDAVSGDDIWAVGTEIFYNDEGYQALAQHWNGSAWSTVATPTPGFHSQLKGVTALSASNVWAVGYFYPNEDDYVRRSLIEHWDGTSWTKVPSPNPSRNGDLNAITATTDGTRAWTVGSFWNKKLGADRTLVAKHC